MKKVLHKGYSGYTIRIKKVINGYETDEKIPIFLSEDDVKDYAKRNPDIGWGVKKLEELIKNK